MDTFKIYAIILKVQYIHGKILIYPGKLGKSSKNNKIGNLNALQKKLILFLNDDRF